jgi:hypothetical protein
MAEESQTNTDGSYLSLFLFLGVTIFYYVSGLKPSMTLSEIQTPPSLDENGNITSSPMEKFQKKKISSLITYILLVLISQYSVNSYVLIKNCGGDFVKNMVTAFFMTMIPWFLIFGAVVTVLFIFPGFKSAFSNVIGYFAVSGQANDVLTTLLKNTNIDNKIDDSNLSAEEKKELESTSEAILKLCGNTGILINQITPDNFIEYWQLIKPLIKRDFIEPGSGEVNSEGAELQEKLLKLSGIRDNIGEALWYTYTATLLVSIVQMNISMRGCQQNTATAEAAREKYLSEQAKYQEQQDKLKAQTYTV